MNAGTKAIGSLVSKGNSVMRRLAGIVGLACMTVVMVCVLSGCSGGVSNDQVESDVQASSVATKGVMRSDYVNDAPYELVDFKVDGKEKAAEGEEFAQMLGIDELQTVSFSGTVRNANFETQFTGAATYGKQGDAWMIMTDPDIASSTTKPLKGVDFMDDPNESKVTWGNEVEPAYSDYSATFDGSDGAWTSSASQTVSYDYWFATDTAKNTCTFRFDAKEGWVPEGDVQVSDVTTSWKLAGKTFGLTERGFLPFSGTVDSTIVFPDASEGDPTTIDYTLNYSPKSGSVAAVSAAGSGAVTMHHTFGEPSFSFDAYDAANSVSFGAESTTSSMVAGAGEVNALEVDILTGSGGNNGYRENGATYNEVV